MSLRSSVAADQQSHWLPAIRTQYLRGHETACDVGDARVEGWARLSRVVERFDAPFVIVATDQLSSKCEALREPQRGAATRGPRAASDAQVASDRERRGQGLEVHSVTSRGARTAQNAEQDDARSKTVRRELRDPGCVRDARAHWKRCTRRRQGGAALVDDGGPLLALGQFLPRRLSSLARQPGLSCASTHQIPRRSRPRPFAVALAEAEHDTRFGRDRGQRVVVLDRAEQLRALDLRLP